LDDCDKVVAVFSPSYLDSKVCIEEFNIAKLRHTEEDCGVLLPIFLYSANLPDYMLRYQYFDCRENDRSKLADACKKIIRKIEEERK
ncbi:MAG TPA: toll/interleukin-1 receptor domain-containing protein, partial [Synergistales bacterium]|nr:toll/interleukin-1 receptor domain-containing protein [Synergistales bacterium]